MENTTVSSIIASFDSTPASFIIGKNPLDNACYLHHEITRGYAKVALRESNQEMEIAGTLVINRETLGGHTFVAVVAGCVTIENMLERPSIRYILNTQGTNEIPRSGVLDFYPSDDNEQAKLCLSIGALVQPGESVNYDNDKLIHLDVGPGATTVSENQLLESLENIMPTPFGEQFVVAKTLAPLLGDAGIEMLYSLQAYWQSERLHDDSMLVKIPNPNIGPVNPGARSAATRLAASM